MNHEVGQVGIKKTYEPPRLTTISLRPEEAVLGHCKTLSGGGNLSAFGCTPIGVCSSIGS
jgi:hypothetical protein